MQAVSSPGSRIGNGEAKSPAAEKNGSSRNGTMEQVKKLVSRLQTSSAEISTVAEVIDQVAKHTNLLALSANIEAARLDTRFTRLAAASLAAARNGIRYVIEDLKEADLGPAQRRSGDLSNGAKQAIKSGQLYAIVNECGVARVFHPIHTCSVETPWSLMVSFEVACALGSV